MESTREETKAQVLIRWISEQLNLSNRDQRFQLGSSESAVGHALSLKLTTPTPQALHQIELELQEILTVVYQKWETAGQPVWPQRRLKVLVPPLPGLDFDSGNPSGCFELTLACQSEPSPGCSEAPPPLELVTHTLVLKGGGIKGLAYIGALEILFQHFRFDRFVGTSAGAILATLLAAGYQPAELKQEMSELNIAGFLDSPRWQQPWNLLLYRGMNSGRRLSDWIDRKLAEKLYSPTPVQLSDLPFRATLFACQRGRDAVRFDSWDNDRLASHAVRCSMSLPGIYIPPQENGIRTYDGGLRHNFPLQPLLEEEQAENRIGLFLGSAIYQPTAEQSEWAELLDIWTSASEYDLLRKHRDDIVLIDPAPIRTLDFSLSDVEKDYLLLCGKLGALQFVAPDSQERQQVQAEYERLKPTIELLVADRVRNKARWRLWLFGIGSLGVSGLIVTVVLLASMGFWKLVIR